MNATTYETRINNLPAAFQARLNRLRQQQQPDILFAHELFICEQAFLLTQYLPTTDDIDRWMALSFYHKIDRIPEAHAIAKHSQAEFGDAWGWIYPAGRLAYWYLKNPDIIAQEGQTPTIIK